MFDMKDYILIKRFGTLAYICFVVHLLVGVPFASYIASRSGSEMVKFVCAVNTSSAPADAYVHKTCFSKYEEKFNSPVKFYAFVLSSFASVILVSVVYSLGIGRRIGEAETILTRSEGPFVDNASGRTFYVFKRYLFHLVMRSFFAVLSFILQRNVLYIKGFDSEYSCIYPTRVDRKINAATTCKHSAASEKQSWWVFMFACSAAVAIFALGEAIWLIWNRCRLTWSCDSEFIVVYLLKKKYVREEIELRDNRAPKSSDIYKERVLKTSLTPDINYASYAANRSLDEMFVDVVIQTGQALHMFEKGMDRHEINNVYMEVPKHSIHIKEIKDLFHPNTDTEGNTPRTILALGRPGIGKTVLARKIMCDWTKGIDEFYWGKIAFLYKFRWFGLDDFKDFNLKTFLRLGTLLNEDEFENVYREILADPKKALFIFDGLDEAGGNVSEFKNLLDRSRLLPNDPTAVMPAMSMFIKITFGYWLNESTILITSRPTAIDFYSKLTFNRTVEIIGFTLDKIEEYVHIFCHNNNQTNLQPKIWSHINSSPEVKNLCYIPVNCFIVCVTLSHCLNNSSNDNVLPTTITELYMAALLYFNKHHDRNINKECDDEVAIKGLQYLAFRGMENDQLVFNEECVNKQMREFGFLNCLSQPIFTIQAQFCFIHLTVQEFLAARHIVETKDPEDIKEFISSHFEIGKWHLVLQFLAGLLGTRMDFDQILDFTKHLTNYLDKDTTCWLAFDNMLVMKWLREVKNEDILKEAIAKSPLKYTTILRSHRSHVLSPSDWAAVVLVSKHLNCLADLVLLGNIERDSLQEVMKLLNVRCIRELTLRGSNVDDCGISQIFHALIEAQCHLSHKHFKLIHLNLNSNSICDDGVSCISELLKNGHGSSLKELDLSQNKITSRGISTLCEGLREKVDCRLTKLRLDGNAIGDDGVRILCKTLIENPFELTELSLCWCSLTSECLEALCEVLGEEHCKVTKLRLRYNSIGDEGVRMLSDALKKEHCALTQLDLAQCFLTAKCMVPLCASLGDEYCKVANLTLAGNAIGDEGVRMLSVVPTKEHCKVTVLDLSHCKLTEECTGFLCASLAAENCKVTELKLGHNAIRDEGVRMLSDVLMKGYCVLTVLNLSACLLTGKCMGSLCAALGDEHCGLTNLNLSANAICDEGASKLFDALSKEQCKLNVLDLSGCSLTGKCLPSLCRALRDNHCCLTQLDVNLNYFTDRQLELLSHTFKQEHSSLKIL